MITLSKHTPRKIPFVYSSRDGIHIQAGKNTPLSDWLLKHNHHKSLYGFCPLSLEDDNTYQDKYKDKDCYIIGKGPSLDRLRPYYFTDKTAPIIAINEAHIRIKSFGLQNPLFLSQADAPPRYYVSYDDTLIVPHKVAHHYVDYPNVYILNYTKVLGYLSSNLAILIGEYFGCKRLKLFCFDAMQGVTGYAKCLDDDLTVKHLADHVSQAARIKLQLAVMKIDYDVIIP